MSYIKLQAIYSFFCIEIMYPFKTYETKFESLLKSNGEEAIQNFDELLKKSRLMLETTIKTLNEASATCYIKKDQKLFDELKSCFCDCLIFFDIKEDYFYFMKKYLIDKIPSPDVLPYIKMIDSTLYKKDLALIKKMQKLEKKLPLIRLNKKA